MFDLEAIRKTVNLAKANRKHLILRVREEKMALDDARTRLGHSEKAQSIIQHVVQHVQEQAHARIAGIVSRCLATVFDNPYEFKIVFDRKRGKTEAKLVFVRDGIELSNPAEEAGGGVVDVAAFALRLASLIYSKPEKRRLLVLDEPFRFTDEIAQERIADLLMILSRELKVQILLITHEQALRIGKVVRF